MPVRSHSIEDAVLGLAGEDVVLVLHADEPRAAAGVAAAASSSMATVKLEQPNSRILPSATSSPSAPIVSAIGVFGSGTWSWYRSMRSVPRRVRLSSTAVRMYAADAPPSCPS